MTFRYICKKLALFVFSLFFVATLTFVLMNSIPGDPFQQEEAVPEEIMKSLYAHYGLDKPLTEQYLLYLKGLITFDLGPSFKYENRTVGEIIYDGFPVSLVLGSEALVLSIFFGILLGSIGAAFRSKAQDHLAMLFAVIGISIPSFIVATFLQYVFSMKLSLLPVARWGTLAHTILPAVSLSALPTAFIARLTRSSMVEVLEQDYVLTARAKGLSRFRVICQHVLKNSLIPVVSYLGPLSASILTGSFVIEKIFGIPGLGGWFVTSITNRDYTVIMGVTMFYSTLLLLAVFLIDIAYGIMDPRIRVKTIRNNHV